MTHDSGDKKIHIFLDGTSPKINVIARLEFELSDYDVTVQYISYYATEILLLLIIIIIITTTTTTTTINVPLQLFICLWLLISKHLLYKEFPSDTNNLNSYMVSSIPF